MEDLFDLIFYLDNEPSEHTSIFLLIQHTFLFELQNKVTLSQSSCILYSSALEILWLKANYELYIYFFISSDVIFFHTLSQLLTTRGNGYNLPGL